MDPIMLLNVLVAFLCVLVSALLWVNYRAATDPRHPTTDPRPADATARAAYTRPAPRPAPSHTSTPILTTTSQQSKIEDMKALRRKIGSGSRLSVLYLDGEWTPYDSVTTSLVIAAVRDSSRYVTFSVSGNTYTVDFDTMTQVNKKTKFHRPIVFVVNGSIKFLEEGNLKPYTPSTIALVNVAIKEGKTSVKFTAGQFKYTLYIGDTTAMYQCNDTTKVERAVVFPPLS